MSDGVGSCGVVPLGEVFVELDRHHLLEVFCVLATGFVDFVDDPHHDMQASRRFRFFDVVLGRLDGFQRNAFASTGHVREDEGFDRIAPPIQNTSEQYGGSCAMRIFSSSRFESACQSSLNKSCDELLLPPPSHRISHSSAPESCPCPCSRHQSSMLSQASSDVSRLLFKGIAASFLARSSMPCGMTLPSEALGKS